ncbi:MAG: hypothetical protein Q4G43_17845 [Mobilicoccus sp.]|nr:hypothetical protein [Mobilicoccus sp.]
MPDAVGAWRSEAPLPTTALYSDGSGDAVSVTFNEAFTAEDDRERLDDPQLIEGWLCGYLLSQDDTVYCTTNAYEGNLSLLATQLDAEEMVAFGHEFLAAWR